MQRWNRHVVLLTIVIGLLTSGDLPAAPGAAGEGRPPLPGQEGSDGTGTVTLADLIQEALEKNPAIQAAQYAASAKKATIESAQTLPDPVLGFQQMGDINPPGLQRGDPSSGRTYSITQEVPFRASWTSRGR